MKSRAIVPGFTYAWMIPYLSKIGRKHGYAISFHGSMSRDLDVVATPWVDNASFPNEVAKEIAKLTGGRIKQSYPDKRPHGRLSYVIEFNGSSHYIDLSVMPPMFTKQDSDRLSELRSSIARRRRYGLAVPPEWISEAKELANLKTQDASHPAGKKRTSLSAQSTDSAESLDSFTLNENRKIKAAEEMERLANKNKNL